jgi:hypothetical protein
MQDKPMAEKGDTGMHHSMRHHHKMTHHTMGMMHDKKMMKKDNM